MKNGKHLTFVVVGSCVEIEGVLVTSRRPCWRYKTTKCFSFGKWVLFLCQDIRDLQIGLRVRD